MAPQREWFEKDYYRVLGVADSASAKEIKSAYRKLSREYHPDTNPGDAAAEERFKEVSAAYDVVGNAERRKEYDEVRRLGPAAAGFPGGAGGPGGFQFQDAGDLGDLLGGLFGRSGRGGRGGRGPHRGQDLETELHLTFDDAVSGVTTAVHLTSDAPCRTCNGSGAKPGTVPHRCSNCGGQGVVSDNQGLFSLSSPCPVCGGRGVTIDDPCPTCRGSGVERRPREVKVRVPAGVDDGQRIRLKGRGGPGQNGGPPGDLFVVVRVAAHPLFQRRGRDLTITVPDHVPRGHPRRRRRRAHPRWGLRAAADPVGHAIGPHVPRQGQGRGHPQGHRGSAGHRGGGGTVQAVERRAQGARSVPSRIRRGVAPRAPRGVMTMAKR